MLAVSVGACLDIDTDLSRGQAFWNRLPLEAFLRGALPGSGDIFIAPSHYNGEKLLVLQHSDPAAAQAAARALFGALGGETDLPVTLALASAPVQAAEVYKAMRATRDALRGHALMAGSLLLALPLAGAPAPEDHPAEALREDLLRATADHDETRLTALLTKAQGEPGTHSPTQQTYLRLLDSLLHDSRLAAFMDTVRYGEIRAELHEALAGSIASPALAADVAAILLRIARRDADEGRRDISEVVDQVERYIATNYRHTLSNEMLSVTFGYVPSYLSKVFRQRKGLSPSEYLVRCRVEKACELMTQAPGILVKEVAETVGYTDPYYFSKIFRKETGRWPKDFQREQEC